MKPQRLLFIHAGGGKTGSSALQSALAEMTSQLAEHGIAYANAPTTQSRYAITSGNGVALFDLVATSRWEEEGADLLESYLGSHAIGICSSEFLGSMSAGNWRKLLETAADRGIEVRVVFFVRPASSYLAACYNQDVKRAGVHVSLVEYLREATWHHLDALMTLDAVIPADALRVRNYDACRSEVASAFATAFPELEIVAKILRPATKRTVNRSLDDAEIAVVRRVNRQLGGKAGEALSDKLIYAMPEKRGGISVEKTQADTIAIKYTDGTSWINKRFFDGATAPLSLNSRMDAPDCSATHDEAQALSLALDWAIEQLGTQTGDNAEAIREALFTIDWQNANLADIPAGFDPFAYLAFNADVVSARVPPFLHYHLSGKHEHRTYNWPQLRDAQQDAEVAHAIAAVRKDGRPETPTERLRRLQHQYQIESSLHAFAVREREYLDEIRRLGERRGFDRAEIREELGKFLQTNAAIVRELEVLGTEQSRLNHALIEREAELERQRSTVSRYREAGLLESVWWAIRRSRRP